MEPGSSAPEDGKAASAWLELLCSEPLAREGAVAEVLRRAGVEITGRPGAGGPGVLFFDHFGPDVVAALRELARGGLEQVIAVAAQSCTLSSRTACALLEAGASDVVAWDSSDDRGRAVATRLARWEAVERLVRSPTVRDYLVGVSPAWISFLRQVVEVAAFTDASVLIIGESGTGKELVARLIHILDPRPEKRDLIVLDSTTIVPELSGSEFFGHERGAFTGAVSAREGAFALADGGTLFLDEVGELPPSLQARLLRVVQEKTYKRVGGNTWQRTEFRLVCATNRDLADEVGRGEFRRDFFYRIAAWICRTPPLRERREDIVPLARHFLSHARPGIEPPEMDGPVLDYLLSRDYPGNIRDLQRLVAQVARRHVGPGAITVGDLPPDARPHLGDLGDWQSGAFDNAIGRAVALGVGLRDIGRAAAEAAIRSALTTEAGNLKRAAKRLGVTDRALQMRRARKDEDAESPASAALDPAPESSSSSNE
jgi:transcriptional regulator with GAF, ATPase, and Fis domain